MEIRIGERSALGFTVTCRRPPWPRLSLVVTCLLAALGFALPEVAFARVAGKGTIIRVRVNNYTQASDGVIAEAEREASRIFGQTGITLVWLSCRPAESTAVPKDPCHEAIEDTDIVLRVLSAPIGKKFNDTVFGFVVHPLLASVYYDRALLRAKSDNAEFEVHLILGCVMAHEIGHLLLSSNGHSSHGVMQAHWERKQIRQAVTGGLLFTPEQARLIQVEAQMRTNLHTARLKE